MEKYRQILIRKIDELSKLDSPFALSRIQILLKLLEEIS